ncbi:hypothetical protein K474DRAFT_1200703 [Panus rudis PR-1116 ss-1]|nr:hypothetical protein K474DRAFT_1200703 [Panus rudis PR-1116 ss-1]
MFPYSFLPLPLIAFLLASPILAVQPSTPYDPFHAIAIHAPKQPEQPICCLRPLTPLEPTEEEVLLTFEEWKAKRLAESHKEPPPGVPPAQKAIPGSADHNGSETNASAMPMDTGISPTPETSEPDTPPESLSPSIPLTDRFNYASMDCSARVHAAHKSAKSTSSILSSKKDRYMLSPCSAQNQFVIVELCDDIRIDTVQLANYEFFSGVFKDFSVSVSKRYTTDPNDWIPAGTYRAKNIRGVQSFHPPATLSDFYRFVRIDFHSHYGNEYYCPLSLLRVYGLTHLEHWKWELWESEARARKAAEEALLTPAAIVVESPDTAHSTAVESRIADATIDTSPVVNAARSANGSISSTSKSASPSTALPSTANLPQAGVTSIHATSPIPKPKHTPQTSISNSVVPSPKPDSPAHLVGEAPFEPVTITSTSASGSVTSTVEKPPPGSTSDTMNSANASSSSSSVSSTDVHVSNTSLSSVPSSSLIDTSNTLSSSLSSSAQSAPTTRSITMTTPIPVHTPLALSVIPTGESIYRTIMNRLAALEANTTLYARYVEEQISSIREVLRRVGEDVGRLEGIGKAQAQMYQRSVQDFERQRRRMEREHSELLLQVTNLTDEVILEKRLGIAQLCLLLAVLVFMALTRGSRSEVFHNVSRTRASSMRDWGKRTFSFSGDWVNKLRSPGRTSDLARPQASSLTSNRSPGVYRGVKVHPLLILLNL